MLFGVHIYLYERQSYAYLWNVVAISDKHEEGLCNWMAQF